MSREADAAGQATAATQAAEGAVVALPLLIVPADVLRFLGYPGGQLPPPRIVSLFDQALDEARRLVSGRGLWLTLPAARAATVGLAPVVTVSELVLGLATIGPALERRVAELLAAGQPGLALLLDAAGSAAAEEAADRLCSLVLDAYEHQTAAPRDAASHRDSAFQPPPDPGSDTNPDPMPAGPRPPAFACRVSPGYGSWPLGAQRDLFALLPHAQVGVELLPSLLMLPEKSISFAVWPEARAPAGETAAGACQQCSMRHCPYRRRRDGPGRRAAAVSVAASATSATAPEEALR